MSDNLSQLIEFLSELTWADIVTTVRGMSEGILFAFFIYGISASNVFWSLMVLGILGGMLIGTIIANDLFKVYGFRYMLYVLILLGIGAIATIVLASSLIGFKENFSISLAQLLLGKKVESLGIGPSIIFISVLLAGIESLILIVFGLIIFGVTNSLNGRQWLQQSIIWSGIFVFLLSIMVSTWQDIAKGPYITLVVGSVGALVGGIWVLPYRVIVSNQPLVETPIRDRDKEQLLLEENERLESNIKRIVGWLPLAFRARTASEDRWKDAIAQIEAGLDYLRISYPERTVDLARARFYYEIGRTKDAEREVDKLLTEDGLEDTELIQEVYNLRQEIHKGTTYYWVDCFFGQCGYKLLSPPTAETVRIYKSEEYSKQYGILIARLLDRKKLVTDSDVRDLLQQTSKIRDSQQVRCLGVIVVSSDTEVSSKARAQQLLLDIETFVILFLKFNDMREAVSRQTSRKLLNDAIYEATQGDPFEHEKPISSLGDFFGRRDEINEMQSRLAGGGKVGLTGIRRIGKTSLMNILRDRCQELGWYVIQIDLQFLKPLTPAVFYAAITQSLERRITDTLDSSRLIEPSPSLALHGDRYLEPEADFSKDIMTLRNFLQKVNPRGQIAVMLDEVGEMITGEVGTTRAINGLSELTTVARIFSSMLLVTPYPDVLDIISEQFRMSGLSIHKSRLSMLKKHECDQMINTLGETRGMGFDKDALALIYSMSGGHPYITRQLCSIIYQKWASTSTQPNRPEKIATKDVEEAVHKYLTDDSRTHYFKDILWHHQLNTEPHCREILSYMARMPGCTLNALQKNIRALHIGQNILDALDQLSACGIIEQIDGRYYIRIKLFEQWLRGAQ